MPESESGVGDRDTNAAQKQGATLTGLVDALGKLQIAGVVGQIQTPLASVSATSWESFVLLGRVADDGLNKRKRTRG